MSTICDSTISDPHNGRMPRRKKLSRAWIIASSIILFALENSACTMGKPPTESLSRAELDLRAATEARADELAPMDLQSAREKLEASKKAMAAKKYDEARRLAELAQVEAELATAKAEAEITRRAAEDLRRRIDSLRAESERGPIPPSSPAAAKE
jgi:multidrug efflux pump subunit AcrA (membrane-fusion protein)